MAREGAGRSGFDTRKRCVCVSCNVLGGLNDVGVFVCPKRLSLQAILSVCQEARRDRLGDGDVTK